MNIKDLSHLHKECIRRKIPSIGPKKGGWLLKKIKELQPQLILELGTANGYSGIILGSEGAKIITIDQNPQIIKDAEQHFIEFNTKATIIFNDVEVEVKNTAKDRKNHNKFDIIFIDFSNKGYIRILNDCIKLIRKGGVIIADNVDMEGCKDFKEKILNHKHLKTEIINLEDGISVSEKV